MIILPYSRLTIYFPLFHLISMLVCTKMQKLMQFDDKMILSDDKDSKTGILIIDQITHS